MIVFCTYYIKQNLFLLMIFYVYFICVCVLDEGSILYVSHNRLILSLYHGCVPSEFNNQSGDHKLRWN